jgi:hypothetical protein
LQPTQAIIQTNQGIIKQQIIQGQSQLVPSQQALITQQPQPQLISTGQVITQPTSQVIIQGNPTQQFIMGNQQLIGSPQLVIGNQQILMGNQQVIGGQIISSGNQQFMSVPTSQQRIIVDQQGNRQLVSIANPQTINMHQVKQEIKPTVTSPPINQANLNQKNTQFDTNQNGNKVGNNIQRVPTPEQPVYFIISFRVHFLMFFYQQKQPPAPPRKIPDEPWVCQWQGCDM